MPLVTRTTSNASVFKQDTEPADKTNGNIWLNTSNDPPSLKVANGTTYDVQGIDITDDESVSLIIAMVALG